MQADDGVASGAPLEGPGLFVPHLETRDGIVVPSVWSLPEYLPRESGLSVPVQSDDGRWAAYPTSADLGLPQHSYAELVDVVCQLPFEMSMRASAIVQALLDRDTRLDGATQVRLAEQLMPGSWVLDRLRKWTAAPSHVIFSEQALFALQRLLVLHAPSRPTDLFDDPATHELFLQALLATPTAVLDRVRQPTTPEQWVAYLMRTGGFYRRESFGSLLARYHRLWHHIASELAGHPDSCPIHEWYAATYGRSIAEDEALTVAVLGGSTQFLWGKSSATIIDEGLPENPLIVSRDQLLATTGLEHRGDELFAAIAATKTDLQDEFNASAGDPDAAAWGFLPFAAHPLVAVGDGYVVPVNPRLVEEWGTGGVYHRLAEAAKRQAGTPGFLQFTRFFGAMVEEYVRHLFQTSLDLSPVLAKRVLPPVKYRGGSGTDEETSDVLVDCAPDVVLVEVVSGRVSQGVLVGADTDAASRDLKRLAIDKGRQLVRVAEDLRNGRALEGPLAMLQPAGIFGVIVSTEGLIEMPSVRAVLGQELAGDWRAAGLEPLVLLSLDDLESLTGLLHDGQGLTDTLRSVGSERWREHGYSAWLAGDPNAPTTTAVNPDINRWWHDAVVAAHALLFPNSESPPPPT